MFFSNILFKSVDYSFMEHRHIYIKTCNLLEQEGLRVVHAHRTFDMGSDMVSSKSLFGQFIKKCENQKFDLQAAITDQMELRKREDMYDASKPYNKYVFDVGDVLRIKDNKRDEYALTAFNEITDKGDLVPMDMNVPIFGNKMINASGQKIQLDTEIAVSLIILSYLKVSAGKGTFRNLRISVHSSDARKVNFWKWQHALIPYLVKLSSHPLGMRELTSGNRGLYAGVFPRKTRFKVFDVDWRYDVFISKNQKDFEHADYLKNWLSKFGYKVFESESDLRDCVTEGLTLCDTMLRTFPLLPVHDLIEGES